MANNNAIFNAVLSGATGTCQERWITAEDSSAYTDFINNVLLVAAAVDALIEPTSISAAQKSLMLAIVQGVFAGRYPQGSDFTNVAESIVALYTAADTQLEPESDPGSVTTDDVENVSNMLGATCSNALNNLGQTGYAYLFAKGHITFTSPASYVLGTTVANTQLTSDGDITWYLNDSSKMEMEFGKFGTYQRIFMLYATVPLEALGADDECGIAISVNNDLAGLIVNDGNAITAGTLPIIIKANQPGYVQAARLALLAPHDIVSLMYASGLGTTRLAPYGAISAIPVSPLFPV